MKPSALAAFLGAALVALVAFLFVRIAPPSESALPASLRANAAQMLALTNRLEVEQGSVRLTRVDGEVVEVAAEARVGIGDRIEVSTDGLATIRWFDDSVSRLSGGTDMRVTAADYAPLDPSETHVRFELTAGTVWSKVAGLVDDASSFEAASGSVVAGVRGTAFNFAVDGPLVRVEAVEHAVSVRAADAPVSVLTRGKAAQAVDGSSARALSVTSFKASDAWHARNKAADAKEGETLKRLVLARLRARVGAMPGETGWEEKQREIALAVGAEDPAARAKALIAAARLRAAESVLALVEGTGSRGAVEAAFVQGDEAITAVNAAVTDEGERARLLQSLRAEIKLLGRALEQALPDDEALYAAKERLRDRTWALAEDAQECERLTALHNRAKLFELQDALLGGWTDACSMTAEVDSLRDYALEDAPFATLLEAFLADAKRLCPRRAPILSALPAPVVSAPVPLPAPEEPSVVSAPLEPVNGQAVMPADQDAGGKPSAY